MALVTEFITVEINLAVALDLVQTIETRLVQQGEPLRWAITQVDNSRQMATVEAVVTRTSQP
ncbi:MAG: hypothetical protein HC922_04805 [Leptolyngbyaceae cyanobacterium SM2_3_12]|nr:hypothetical protein [Leptolyngbyaceae cyanobacterium SM2_3_12]